MYDIVKAQAFEKATSVDINRIGTLARAGMTAMVRQMLTPTLGWADFSATFANGSFVLNVSDGFLYKGGAQHKTAGPTPIDLVNDAPPSASLKRIVSIVAYALPAADGTPEQREFATQVTPASGNVPATYQTETRTTNVLNSQVAGVARYLGDIAPQPTPPTLASDLCEIARVVLGQGGIESVVFVEDNRVPNLTGERARLNGVVDFVEGQGRRIDTLDKNLAALSALRPMTLSTAQVYQLFSNVAQINQVIKLKTGDLSYGIDYGLDLRYSDNTYNGYLADVEDGIRFPWASSKQVPLSLFTPGDPVTKVVASLLLPNFDEEARLTVDGMDGSLNIANQVNTTTTATQVSIPRTAVRYGEPFTVCTNSAFWQSGQYDPGTNIFTSGEGGTYQFLGADGTMLTAPGHEYYRLEGVWTDTTYDVRTTVVTVPIGLNGAIRAQTFRVPDFGYLTSIDLPFVTADPSYGVTLLLCECRADGAPDLGRVLERCDVAANGIVADAGGKVRTKFAFRPPYVKPGKLYAWATVTRGNYSLATVKDNKFAEGSSFLSTDQGGLFQGDSTIDFAFTANFARFKSPRVEIRLNDVDNVNGDPISALKFLYGSVIPDGTSITHMAKRSGGDWQVVGQIIKGQAPVPLVGAGPFSSAPLPVSVQQKVVLAGTTTLMPGIDLTQAWVTALRLGTVRNHVSTPIGLGTNCNRTEVTVVVDGPFDPAQHATDCKLIVAGADVTAAAVTPTQDPANPGRWTFVYAFTHATTNTLRFKLPGTLTTNLATYHVESRFFRSWLQ